MEEKTKVIVSFFHVTPKSSLGCLPDVTNFSIHNLKVCHTMEHWDTVSAWAPLSLSIWKQPLSWGDLSFPAVWRNDHLCNICLLHEKCKPDKKIPETGTYFSPKVITKPCDHAKELSWEAEHTAYAWINKEDFNTLNRVVWAWFRKQVLSLNLLWSCFTHYVWCHELGHCRHRGFEFNGLLRCMMSWTKILRHKWKVNDQTCSECQTIHRTAW